MIGTAALLDYKPSAPAITGKAPMDSRDIAGDILRRQSQMEADRANWESYWQQIADFVAPQTSFTVKRESGFRQGTEVFDSTPELASDRFSAAFNSILTPKNQMWHLLKPVDDDLADDAEVKRWTETVNKRLWSQRYRPRGNFASQIHEVYKSLGDFGTGGIFSEEIPGEGLIYKACNLNGLFVTQDLYGRVTYIHYRFEMTVEQAAQRFGVDQLPDQIRTKLETRPDDKATYIHCVRPNYHRLIGSPGVPGMAFESWWVCKDARQVVGKGGFRTFPYAVSRYVMRSGEVYGRSPAMMALADILMLNTMGQVSIQEAQLSISPPLLAPHDGVMSALGDGVSLMPGAINWGGVDPATGRPLIHPLNRGSQWAPLKDEIRDRRQSINAAFLVTLFQIMVDTPQMTATEAMLRAQEKGALLAPVAERQESELLGPIIERELDLLGRSGAFTPMPDALAQSRDGMKVEYDNPMKQAMMASQGVGLVRTIEALTPLAAVDKSVLDVFNPDEIGPGLAEINGVPSKWIRTKDEITAIRQGRQQQVDLEQLVNAAPQVTGAIKNMADVQNSAGTPRF
jgi:hypothetical protein